VLERPVFNRSLVPPRPDDYACPLSFARCNHSARAHPASPNYFVALVLLARLVAAQGTVEYERRELKIPMRDGVMLFAVALIPKAATAPLPILLIRTPFSAARELQGSTLPELAGSGAIRLGDRQIVDATALEQTHIPAIVLGVDPQTGVANFYGLGWSVGYGTHGVEWSHAGAFTRGARTVAYLLPDQRLGIVVLTSAFPTGVPEGLVASFLDMIFEGKPSQDWIAHWNGIFDTALGAGAQKAAMAPYASPPANPGPPLALPAYAGTYTNDYVGNARIEDVGSELVLHLGPADRRYALTEAGRPRRHHRRQRAEQG